MARFRTLIGLGLASTMMITAPVFATTAATATAKPVAHMQPAQTTATTPKVKASTPARTATARPKAHLAKATLSNGKKVTYNCNLAGNKNKEACKS